MRNGDEASLSIILAGRALFVEMLITLEPRGALRSNFADLCIYNIIWPLVCKFLTRLYRGSFSRVDIF